MSYWVRFVFLLAFIIVISSFLPKNAIATTDEDTAFITWVEDLKKDARKLGVSELTLSKALKDVKIVKRVVELDRNQTEFTLTFWKYLNNSINDKRIKRGQKLLKEHKVLLEKVSKKFGVQPRFLVAFWGLESNFGDYTGVFPAIQALVTLSYDKRRAEFFREQLLALLGLMDEGSIPFDIKGSWAGAMGNHQFIPTTYRDFAVDYDGDQKRDLWKSLPDIFASAANYLGKSGWEINRTWGREVKLPKGFNFDLSGLDTLKNLSEWQQIGVRRFDGRNLPQVDVEASMILPAGANGPAFLIYENFRTTLKWNRSIFYAIAIGHLADRYVGGGKFLSPQNKEIPLARTDVIEIQQRLTKLGHDTGGADGIAGSQTRKAIKFFQKTAMLPADGYASMGLLERLRGIK